MIKWKTKCWKSRHLWEAEHPVFEFHLQSASSLVYTAEPISTKQDYNSFVLNWTANKNFLRSSYNLFASYNLLAWSVHCQKCVFLLEEVAHSYLLCRNLLLFLTFDAVSQPGTNCGLPWKNKEKTSKMIPEALINFSCIARIPEWEWGGGTSTFFSQEVLTNKKRLCLKCFKLYYLI